MNTLTMSHESTYVELYSLIRSEERQGYARSSLEFNFLTQQFFLSIFFTAFEKVRTLTIDHFISAQSCQSNHEIEMLSEIIFLDMNRGTMHGVKKNRILSINAVSDEYKMHNSCKKKTVEVT